MTSWFTSLIAKSEQEKLSSHLMSRLFCVNRSLHYKDSIVSLAYLLVWLFTSSNKLSGRRRWKKSEKEGFSGSCTRRKHLITCEVEPLARQWCQQLSRLRFLYSLLLSSSLLSPSPSLLSESLLSSSTSLSSPPKMVIDILFADTILAAIFVYNFHGRNVMLIHSSKLYSGLPAG